MIVRELAESELWIGSTAPQKAAVETLSFAQVQ